MAMGRRMVKTCWLNGKYFDAVRMSYTKGVFGSKIKQLGCRLLMTVIQKGVGSVPTGSLVGQWRHSLGKVSCSSEKIIFMVICKLDTSGFKCHR